MRYSFTLPSSFDPMEFLPGRLALHADAARWVVSTILRRTAARDMDAWGCARFSCDELDRVMGDDAVEIIRALDEAGVIDGTPHRPGAKTRSFRLGARFAGCRFVRVRCEDPAVEERLLQEVAR